MAAFPYPSLSLSLHHLYFIRLDVLSIVMPGGGCLSLLWPLCCQFNLIQFNLNFLVVVTVLNPFFFLYVICASFLFNEFCMFWFPRSFRFLWFFPPYFSRETIEIDTGGMGEQELGGFMNMNISRWHLNKITWWWSGGGPLSVGLKDRWP